MKVSQNTVKVLKFRAWLAIIGAQLSILPASNLRLDSNPRIDNMSRVAWDVATTVPIVCINDNLFGGAIYFALG